MANYREELPQLIFEAEIPILCLFIEGRCKDPGFESRVQKLLTDMVGQTEKRFILYTVCHSIDDMPFPQPKPDSVYFFAPGYLKPISMVHVSELISLDNLNGYVNGIYKMMEDHDLPFYRAIMDEEAADSIEVVEEMLEEEQKDPEYPSFMHMVRGFTKDMVNSAKRVGRSLPVIVPKDVAQERYELCLSCPYFTEDKRCEKCGCFMVNKVNLAASECPIGKWEQYEG